MKLVIVSKKITKHRNICLLFLDTLTSSNPFLGYQKSFESNKITSVVNYNSEMKGTDYLTGNQSYIILKLKINDFLSILNMNVHT